MADAAKTCLQIAQTLSFGIPPPYGIVIAGAMQLFEAFLPTDTPPDRTGDILTLVEQLPAEIGNDSALSQARSYLSGLNDAVAQVKQDWDRAKGRDSELTTIENGIESLKPLSHVSDQGPSDLHALLSTDLSSTHAYAQGMAALDAAMNLMMGRILAFKAIVELQSGMIAVYTRRASVGLPVDPSDLAEATNWLHTYHGHLVTVATDYVRKPADGFDPTKLDISNGQTRHDVDSLVQGLRKVRGEAIAKAGVQTKGMNNDANGSCETHFILDTLLDPSSQQQLVSKDTSQQVYVSAGPGGGFYTWEFDCCSHDVSTQIDGYRSNRLKEFDDAVAFVDSTFDQISAQLQQVRDIPPDSPPIAPTVQWSEPVDSRYVPVPDGWEIAWGVRFENECGQSSLRWSEWQKPIPGHGPVVGVPGDPAPTALTTSREVWRVIRKTDDSQPTLPNSIEPPADASYAATVNGAAPSHLIDQWPAIGSGLVPLPAQPISAVRDADGQDLIVAADGASAMRYSYSWIIAGNPASRSPIRSVPTAWVNPSDAPLQLFLNPPADPDSYDLVVFVQHRAEGEDPQAWEEAKGSRRPSNPGQLWVFETA